MSEQYDEQPVDQAGEQPAEESADSTESTESTEEVLTDPETGETVATPLAAESVELSEDLDDLSDPTEDEAEAPAEEPAAEEPADEAPADEATDEAPADEATDEAAADEAADEDADAADDPMEEFRTALREKEGDWFVVHTYSGMENRVKANLENRITSLNMEHYIHEVIVPTEEVAEIKNGQRKLVKRTVLPGYVLVRMDLTDESWSAVRHTPSVTGFVGHSHQPVPLSLDEVENMLAPAVQARGRGRRHAGVRGRRHPPRPPRASRSRSPTSTCPTRSWSSTARSPRCTRRSPRSTPRHRGSRPSSRSSAGRPRSS